MGIQISWEDATRRQHTFFQISILLSWRRKWQPIPVFLPGESHGQRSLVGCRPWGRTESNMTEATQQQQQHFVVQFNRDKIGSWSLWPGRKYIKKAMSMEVPKNRTKNK